MANIFPAQKKVTPSFSEPDLIVTYAQASGFMGMLPEGKPRVRIGSGDLQVYINTLDIRTEVLAGQSPSNLLPNATLVGDFIGTPTYLMRARAIWDRHDIAAAANYNVSLPSAQDVALRQGIFQQIRSGFLYGFNPANGEGMLNTAGATSVNLPPDSYGNTTTQTYDNGQMALFWLSQIVALKSGMWQTGGNIKNKIVVLSPQRVWQYFVEAAIVQVTSYQRPGGGTATIGDVIQDVAKAAGDQFDWYLDDTLIGKGASGADAVLLAIPEVEIPNIPGLNTNVFGSEFQPQMKDTIALYTDMAAPTKIPTPIPDGAITEVQEQRVTSGWCIRPDALRILSLPY